MYFTCLFEKGDKTVTFSYPRNPDLSLIFKTMAEILFLSKLYVLVNIIKIQIKCQY